MGFFDSIENLAAQELGGGANTNANVAGGVMQALEEHPGGLAGVMDHLTNNGMGEHVQNWSQGTNTATPDQIQQGLAGSGFLENVAAKAGVSPQVASMAMSTILPMVMSHFTNCGQQAPPQSGFGGMASQILGRFL
jgi:uncharacterized protein YidB (DUF937 family)